MLPKGPYDPNTTEPEILKFWLENKFFKPEYHPEKGLLSMEDMKKDGRESFCIINPPPNAYMRPHIGNVSGYAYQDVFLRYNRLLGKKVLGQPGKDHAGIQGEVVLEKTFLENKGKTKQDMGRDKFYFSAYDHFQKLMPKIMADEQRIGLSSDYDRNIFTLDPKIVSTVMGTFIKLFQDNMVYKGVRIVNWDPVAQTTLADIDTERVERETELIYIKYPFKEADSSAWKLREKYINKEIEWTFERWKTKDGKIEMPFAAGSNDEIGVIAIGYEKDLKPGEKYTGKVIGVHLNLTNPQRIVVLNPKAEVNLNNEDIKIFDFEKNYYAGPQIVFFDGHDKPEDYKNAIFVATTRAETMLGDTAVVVNPDDIRYKGLIGKKVELPLTGREIPIISSSRVDKEFGTGAVKLTPAHSYDDYIMMLEWNEANPEQKVEYINVINKEAKMCGPVAKKYCGMSTTECRKLVESDLEKFLIKREKHIQNVMVGERSKAVIEQIMSSQWFIDVEKLKQPAIDVVKSGKVNIFPKYMTKKYLQWLENLKDWPVSRSLWWGYRFPVWYKGKVEEKVDEKGKIIQTIGEETITNIDEAVKMGFAKVQIDPPGIKFTVLRHGETQNNVDGKFIGFMDDDLNENGKKQAKVFAEKILKNGEKYDVIITSPLKRAKGIAEIICKENNIPVVENGLLKERNFGELEGLTWEEFAQKFPGLAKTNTPTYQENLPTGESIPQVESRVKEFLNYVKKEYQGKKILVITHAGIIRIIKREIGGVSLEESRKEDIKNTESLTYIIKEEGWLQDDSVFDTWFSSGQWPYATLSANDLMDTFFPTDIIETAHDILELWVSRMIMLSMYHEGKIPFKNVFLHGMVKAADGQKMSKSKNNVIVPDDIINKYGADSLRLLYLVGNTPGASYPVSYEKLEGYKRFLNKIWNAAKFVLNYVDVQDGKTQNDEVKLTERDKEMLSKMDKLTEKIKKQFAGFRIGLAAEELYQEFWHDFCDIYLEEVKPRLYTKDKEGIRQATNQHSRLPRE